MFDQGMVRDDLGAGLTVARALWVMRAWRLSVQMEVILPVGLGRDHPRTGNPPETRMCSAVKGSKATWRALFKASVNMRWWRAQVPVLRRGSILPRSET